MKIHHRSHFILVPSFDALLENSYGYCVYKHQLEQIHLMLSHGSVNDSFLFRRNWNKKQVAARSEAEQFRIAEQISLHQFMEQRSVEPNLFVFEPEERAALILWSLINKL